MWRLDRSTASCARTFPWVKRLPEEHIRDNVRVATQPITEVTAGRVRDARSR